MEGRELPQKGENCRRREKIYHRREKGENYHSREGIATEGRTAMEGREQPRKGENCHAREGKVQAGFTLSRCQPENMPVPS